MHFPGFCERVRITPQQIIGLTNSPLRLLYIHTHKKRNQDMDIRTPISPQSTRFLDRFRNFIRLRGLAYKTEKTYVFWIKRFIRFHGRKHPETMGSAEVEAFLSHPRSCPWYSVRMKPFSRARLFWPP